MKLWLDVEDLFHYAAHNARLTGIQRLTGELYAALVECDPLAVGFVRHGDRCQFKTVSWKDVRDTYKRLRGDVLPAPVAPTPPVSQVASSTGNGSFLVRLKASFARQSTTTAVPTATCDADCLNKALGPDDVLCTFGAFWHDIDYAERIARLQRASGVRLAVLVHDLIPVLRPEYFETERVRNFGEVMAATLPMADVILANSKATARDVVKWADWQSVPLRSTPQHIPIGTGFERPPTGALPKDLTANEYVLFVSTIETRKNHLQAFRVWRRLLDELPPDKVPTLVFAGAWGWMVEDLKKAIERTSALNGKLVIVSEPDDATLSALYQGCQFTLFLSYYEGWGLPVSDSLAFGKICIASQRTSIPEAGGPFCVYVDPDNTSATYETIRRIIEQPQELAALERKLHRGFKPVTWSAAAAAVWEAAKPPTGSTHLVRHRQAGLQSLER